MEYIRMLGSGGQARIFLVRIKQEFFACKESEKTDMLEREAYFLRLAENKHFVRYKDFFRQGKKAFLLMEYIEGKNLAEIMCEMQIIGHNKLMKLLIQTAEGLEFLHSMDQPIIHRDLKPENIMISIQGDVKIIDMGCACFAGNAYGRVIGTRGFAPKEQLEGQNENQGLYSDVYAFGKMMQYLLWGENPYLPSAYSKRPKRIDRWREKDLFRLAELCINEEGWNRPPDMRYVLHELMLLSQKKSLLQHCFVKTHGIMKKDFIYEKNIFLR